MPPLVSQWVRTLVLSEKLVYQEKGSQRTANNVMVALSGYCRSCSILLSVDFRTLHIGG